MYQMSLKVESIDEMFDTIDSSDKAYLLGLISAKYTTIKNSTIDLNLDNCDFYVLGLFKRVFSNHLSIEHTVYYHKLTVTSTKLADKLREIFKIENEEYSMPDLPDEYIHYFTRGVFEGNGYFGYNGYQPFCSILSSSQTFLKDISDKCKLQCNITDKSLEFSGNSVLDFLNSIYGDVLGTNDTLHKKKCYEFYKQLAGWMPNTSINPLYFNYVKTCPEAKPPQKQRASDSGYDLTLMKKIKVHGNVEFYDTCIKLQPTFGYYFDLVGRSSISKSGYMLANNVGIIDRTYQGSVIVPLIKLDKKQPDLELPCRLVQIIPRQIHHLEPIEITEENLSLSDRQDGGFGSTGK